MSTKDLLSDKKIKVSLRLIEHLNAEYYHQHDEAHQHAVL